MNLNLRNALLVTSLVWGILLLVVGFFASLSIGVNDTASSLTGFLLIFGVPIISSVAARWIPRVAGFALLAAVIIVLIGFYVDGGTVDVLRVLSKVYLWFHVAFGVLFIVLAGRINSRAIDRKSS